MARSFASLRRGLDHLFQPFWHWWTSEIAATAAAIGRTSGLGRIKTIVSLAEGGIRVFAEQNGRRRPLLRGAIFPDVARAIDAGFARDRVGDLVLRLRPSDCFVRTIELPAAARRDAPRILALDLERTTPFRSDDVLTAALLVGGAGTERLLWRQYIVKRTRVAPLIGELERTGQAPASVDCWNDDESAALELEFTKPGAPPRRRSDFRVAAGLAAAIAVLAGSAMALEIARLEAALASIRPQITTARADAEAARAVIARSEAALAEADRLVRRRREAIPPSVIVEDLSRLLPDTVWLTDLRIENGMVEFSGFAPAAAQLVAIVARSQLLDDPALTAPVTYDAREGRERFSLRARLRAMTELPSSVNGG